MQQQERGLQLLHFSPFLYGAVNIGTASNVRLGELFKAGGPGLNFGGLL